MTHYSPETMEGEAFSFPGVVRRSFSLLVGVVVLVTSPSTYRHLFPGYLRGYHALHRPQPFTPKLYYLGMLVAAYWAMLLITLTRSELMGSKIIIPYGFSLQT